MALLVGTGLLVNCVQVPPVGGHVVSVQEAARIDSDARRTLAYEYAVLDAPALQVMVDTLGRRLAALSSRPELRWQFVLLDSPDVNAFSLPGGEVCITRGLLAYLATEAQLAAVIAHEIGHVVAGDALQVAALAYADNQDRLGSLLTPDFTGSTERWRTGYGDARELAADTAAAQLLARAGFAPQALIDTLTQLAAQARVDSEKARADGRMLRHYHGVPGAGVQAQLPAIVAAATRELATAPQAAHGSYLHALAGLAFDDSAGERSVRAHQLQDATAGYGFAFPVGWQIRIQAQRVVATSPQHDALIEFRSGPAGANTLDTLHHLALDPGAKFVPGKLDGYAASFGAGTVESRPALVAAVAFGNTQYLIAGLCRDGAAYALHRETLKTAINSFHVLTAKARAAARPRTIQLLTATADTRLAAVAAKSGIDEAQLRVLNGLYPAGEPRIGQVLKVVE